MKRTLSLILALALCSGIASAGSSEDNAQTQAHEQARKDCRIEGQAVGLAGMQLEAFVERCAEELSGLTFINVAR